MAIKAVAVIPARGGSKRILKKNILDFMGKPMIAWSIRAAKEAKIFDRIIVSTDDEEIASVARNHGIDVPFLRVVAVDDVSPVTEATINALRQAQNCWNEDYDIVVQLMANCPLRGAKEIVSAYDNFTKSGLSFQISAFKFGWMNPWWAAKLDGNSSPQYLFPEALKTRSQDLEELYCPTGAIWIADVKKLFKERTFYGPGHTFFPIDWKAAVDIDNYEDVAFAKAIYASLLSE